MKNHKSYKLSIEKHRIILFIILRLINIFFAILANINIRNFFKKLKQYLFLHKHLILLFLSKLIAIIWSLCFY